VAVEATQAVGEPDPGAKDKSCALSSTVLVKLRDAIEFSGNAR
jgi:hypothetical protein